MFCCFETQSSVTQAGFKLLGSNDSPTSVPHVAGKTGMCHDGWLLSMCGNPGLTLRTSIYCSLSYVWKQGLSFEPQRSAIRLVQLTSMLQGSPVSTFSEMKLQRWTPGAIFNDDISQKQSQ